MKVISLKKCLSTHSVTSVHMIDDHDGGARYDFGIFDGVLILALVSSCDKFDVGDIYYFVGFGHSVFCELLLELQDGMGFLHVLDVHAVVVVFLDDNLEAHLVYLFLLKIIIKLKFSAA